MAHTIRARCGDDNPHRAHALPRGFCAGNRDIIEAQPVQPAMQFVALCEPCGYTGPIRTSTLQALNDFDRHAASAAHLRAADPTHPNLPEAIEPLSPFQRSVAELDGGANRV